MRRRRRPVAHHRFDLVSRVLEAGHVVRRLVGHRKALRPVGLNSNTLQEAARSFAGACWLLPRSARKRAEPPVAKASCVFEPRYKHKQNPACSLARSNSPDVLHFLVGCTVAIHGPHARLCASFSTRAPSRRLPHPRSGFKHPDERSKRSLRRSYPNFFRLPIDALVGE